MELPDKIILVLVVATYLLVLFTGWRRLMAVLGAAVVGILLYALYSGFFFNALLAIFGPLLFIVALINMTATDRTELSIPLLCIFLFAS